MFCKQCGKQLNDGAAFCPNCGTPAEIQTNVPSEQPKNSEGEKKKFKIIALAVALVVVIGGVGAWAYTSFLQSADDYFKTVVKNSVKSGAPGIAEVLSLNADEISLEEFGSELTLDITLGEPLRDLIAENADYETSQYIGWIENAKLDCDVSYADMLYGLNAKINANDTELATAELTFDFENGDMYIKVPEINDTAIKAKLDGYDVSTMTQEIEAGEMLLNAWPKAAVIEELLVRYAQVIADEVDKIEKSKESVTVGDVTKKCTLLTITLDEETALNMVKAVLTEARDDKKIEKIIKDFSSLEMIGVDADEAYSEYQNEIDEALEELEDEVADSEEYLELLVWVNGKDEIIGIEEEQYSNSRFIVLDDGKNIVSTISMEADGVSLAIDGSGKRSGNKLDMEYALSAMGMEVLKLTISDFDEKKAEKGLVDGTFVIEPGDGAGALLGAAGDDMASLISGFRIEIQVAQKSMTDYSANIAVNTDDELFAQIAVSANEKDSTDVVVPEKFVNSESEDEMSDWILNANLAGLLDSLNSANASRIITSALEQAVDFLELAKTMNSGAVNNTSALETGGETIEF